MKKNKISSICLVGGIPNPIGGVTSFVKRLAEKNMVDYIFDLYPSKDKVPLEDFIGKVIYCHNVWLFFLKFNFFTFRNNSFTYHFNFSTPKSLFLFFFYLNDLMLAGFCIYTTGC